jgi:ABC-type Fe3+ transport system permease subunit
MANAIVNTVLTIISFFFLGYFPKFVWLLYTDGDKLNVLQILADPRLWSLDVRFWVWAISLSTGSIVFACLLAALNRRLSRRNFDDGRKLQQKLLHASRLDYV